MSKIFFGLMALLTLSLLSTINNPLKENNLVQLAIQTLKIQVDLSEDVEVKFVEKRESPIPDFIMIKLLVVTRNREVPTVVYVDRSAEKVIIGDLFIRGENTTLKETGDPRISKIGLRFLDPGKASLSY